MEADHLHLPLPIPQDLNDSQLIHTSNPHQAHFKNSSMVLIRDSFNHNDCSVFPPINHENLHPIPLQQQQQRPSSPSLSSSSSSSLSSSSSSSFSPSDAEYSDPESPLPPETRVQKPGSKTNTWVGFGFEVLRSKLLAFASSFIGYRWGIQSFGSTCVGIIGMAMMIWSLYMRSRQRRSREKLMQLVKQKDQKIFQLLHQIAELNEVLVARHRLPAN